MREIDDVAEALREPHGFLLGDGIRGDSQCPERRC